MGTLRNVSSKKIGGTARKCKCVSFPRQRLSEHETGEEWGFCLRRKIRNTKNPKRGTSVFLVKWDQREDVG